MVAWTMLDGNTMCGIVEDYWDYGSAIVYVGRIDGGVCEVKRSELRPATLEDFQAAAAFFRDIGKV